MKGIDVSDNQGVIAWDEVKAAGCGFAILRSVRRSGKADYQFEANVKGCREQNIPISVYKYTYATTENNSILEANQVIGLLKEYGLECIIWWDVEDRETLQPLGKKKLTACIQAAKKTVEEAGFCFGIYSGAYVRSEGWFDFDAFASVPMWGARYYNGYNPMQFDVAPDETKKPDLGRSLWGWQYTSTGSVPGISGNVDFDICWQNPESVPEFFVEEAGTTRAALRYGSRGTDVTYLQQSLTEKGYDAGDVDGIFGKKTLDAIKAYQLNNGLVPDGIVGAKTWAALEGKAGGDVEAAIQKFSLEADGDKYISENFKISEFRCKDGSDIILIDVDFVTKKLQIIRDHFGKPVTINSAYRTESYNTKIGGAKSSYHMKGQAFDIVVNGHSPQEVAHYAQTLSIPGIIQYNTFVHVDGRPNRYWAKNNNGKIEVIDIGD